MASETIYGDQVGHWRCYGDWWTTETNTQVTVSCRVGMQSIAWGFQISDAITARANIDNSIKDATGDFYSETGATVSKEYVTHSVTYDKTTSAKEIDVWAKIINSSGYEGGESTAHAIVTLPALASYSVTYNANGGSGAPSAQTKYYGKTLTLSSTKPTRTGYTFQGWATSSSSTTVAYKAGASYTSNAALNLYAVWQQNCLIVNYYSNYATSSFSDAVNVVGKDKNVLVLTQKFAYDTKYQYGLADYSGTGGAAYMTRDGYNPTGYWGTELSGGTLVPESKGFDTGQALAEAFGKTLNTGNVSINIYAQWTIKTYTVTYNKNTTDTVSNMPSNQTKTYGKTLALSSNIPTRAGYGFQGWATSANGKVVYASGANYTANNGATLYAVWEADTYIVSYNSNAGDDAVIVPSSQSKVHNVPLTLSSDVPTRKQYKFKYWTNAQGTIQYHPGDTYSLNESITLYAVWELTASKVTIYDNTGNPQSYLCYVYDESGAPHYAIVSIYDAQGVPHSVT